MIVFGVTFAGQEHEQYYAAFDLGAVTEQISEEQPFDGAEVTAVRKLRPVRVILPVEKAEVEVPRPLRLAVMEPEAAE